jgi:hypothetical protein
MDVKDLWRLGHSDVAVATGHGDTLVVGRVTSWTEDSACIGGCNAQGKRASDWYDAKDLRMADDAEAEMYQAWCGLEFYRDVFPQACAWIAPNVEESE